MIGGITRGKMDCCKFDGVPVLQSQGDGVDTSFGPIFGTVDWINDGDEFIGSNVFGKYFETGVIGRDHDILLSDDQATKIVKQEMIGYRDLHIYVCSCDDVFIIILPPKIGNGSAVGTGYL